MESRLCAAQEIAAIYAGDAAVTTVLCGGSTGRGHADRWSDLEIGVFWSRPPDDQRRLRVITELGGADPRRFDYDVAERQWFDEWWFDGGAGAGLLVEVVHMTETDADDQLDRLLVANDVRPGLLAFAAALAYGQPLAGSAERLTARVRDYPTPVATAVVSRHGQIDNFWRWKMYLERQDIHGLRRHFASVTSALTHILCALNQRWWPGSKWQPRVLADLPIAPSLPITRLAEVDQLPPADGAARLAQLVEETYDLVAVHLPEVDIDRLRSIFRFARAPWPRSSS